MGFGGYGNSLGGGGLGPGGNTSFQGGTNRPYFGNTTTAGTNLGGGTGGSGSGALGNYIQLGLAAYGMYDSYRQGKDAKRAGKMGDAMSALSQKQHTMAEPALQKAMQYYMALAGGGPAARNALAPNINAVNKTYGAASNTLANRMAPGPTRDRQMAEMERERAGNVAGMPLAAQGQAVGNLMNFGTVLSGLGSTSFNNSMAAYQQQMVQKQLQQQQNQQLGASVANIFMPYLTGQSSWSDWQVGGKKKAGTGAAGQFPNDYNWGEIQY